MPLLPRLCLVASILPLGACLALDASDSLERTATQTFTVSPHSTVHVTLHGGSIVSETGPAGAVHVELVMRIRADSDREADRVLDGYDIAANQRDGDVWVSARRKKSVDWQIWKLDQVHVSATLRVPPDVQLDADTSGGSITARGDRTERTRADTSGGSIRVDGGASDMDLDTSGGSITVERALSTLRADTSGGSIHVHYVGPATRTIDLDTSGGSIDVGVDPTASLRVAADTSGGGVSVSGLPFSGDAVRRSHAHGTINGGTGTLRASTSGGSIHITAAAP
jgi:formylmethanofuran dehydrogenase subunit C